MFFQLGLFNYWTGISVNFLSFNWPGCIDTGAYCSSSCWTPLTVQNKAGRLWVSFIWGAVDFRLHWAGFAPLILSRVDLAGKSRLVSSAENRQMARALPSPLMMWFLQVWNYCYNGSSCFDCPMQCKAIKVAPLLPVCLCDVGSFNVSPRFDLLWCYDKCLTKLHCGCLPQFSMETNLFKEPLHPRSAMITIVFIWTSPCHRWWTRSAVYLSKSGSLSWASSSWAAKTWPFV